MDQLARLPFPIAGPSLPCCSLVDQQLDADVKGGKLDQLARQAKEDSPPKRDEISFCDLVWQQAVLAK